MSKPQYRPCRECGAAMRKTAKFCSRCGSVAFPRKTANLGAAVAFLFFGSILVLIVVLLVSPELQRSLTRAFEIKGQVIETPSFAEELKKRKKLFQQERLEQWQFEVTTVLDKTWESQLDWAVTLSQYPKDFETQKEYVDRNRLISRIERMKKKDVRSLGVKKLQELHTEAENIRKQLSEITVKQLERMED